MNNQAAQTMPPLPKSFGEHCVYDSVRVMREPGYTADQMHQYARDYAAMLAAAPAASGGEYPGCSGDPASCPENEGHGCCKPNPARHVAIVCDWKNADPFPTFIEAEIGGKSVSLEWRDRPDGLKELIVPVTAAPQPPSAASVSERARIDTLALDVSRRFTQDTEPQRRASLQVAVIAAIEQALTQQRGEVEDEDYHVIMSMGRLLAEIAVILKGAEPAGTAWSYHDLPELVKSAVENAHDIASEMRAWAAVKMRERGSSRRDKMMVEEWSKRLLALPEVAFPVKDFDIPGLSITKEEIRFAIRKVVADRVFIGQDFGGTTPQPSADAVREDSTRLDWIESQIREYGDGYTEPREAGWGIQWQQERPDHYWPGLRAWIDEERRRASGDELESLLSAASGEKGVDDTKRLDWIARQGGYEFDFGILNDQPGDGDWFVHGMVGSGQGATFRDAIDAAIKEEAGGQDANTDILDTLAFKTENGDAGRGSVTYIALVASGEADHQQNAAQGGGEK